MGPTTREFIRTYVKAIRESNAAIFAGAGLSRSAGFVDWKELMREIAEDLQLDVDKETDLISLAQYHVNERGRGKINQLLIEEFTRDCVITENHRIIARLPVETFWTTNYDKMLEKALEEAGRRVDVKMVPENLAISLPGRDAIVYKMHGDISQPNEAVLTKDDYERYNQRRKQFTLALEGDLIQKTFLFIGFSFDDPNLTYILSRIRALLGENHRDHYCFMKCVSRSDFKTDEDFRYALIKHDLRVKDLKRYGINAIMVEDYPTITDVLRVIESQVKLTNVFISGSASEYGEWGEERALEFAFNLSKRIIQLGKNIITGFGLGIGSCVISGALEELYRSRTQRSEHRLRARPFPQVTTGDIPLSQLWTQYRREMLSQVGIAIFMFGNKINKENGSIIAADGMEEEFEIAIEQGAVPIPIGTTGYTARTLWERVVANFDRYVPNASLQPLYQSLGAQLDNQALIELVAQIIEKLQETYVVRTKSIN
ncbi:MAG: SIR2 family protein [Alicyclobacillus sp.]|nr:SIR2 family protein [Alicyclobacillus sp.]